jgi:hypothetical protein
MRKCGARQSIKKAKKGAVICQKMDGACDFDPMNTLDRWSRRLSLVCGLVLGLEGLMFAHNAVVQARLLGPTVTVKIDKPVHQLVASNDQVAR